MRDLTPRFLKFYELARDADPDRRWALWEEHYGFAAVPPTEAGMQMARRLLDTAWDRYPDALPIIRAGAAGFRPDPEAALEAVCRLLEFKGELTVRFVVFVGGFEENAFAYTMDGTPVVHFPIEGSETKRAIMMPHEFAHVVHDRLCESPGGYLRSIAMSLMQEGIAIHTAQTLAPGRPEREYIESEPGWLERCRARDRQILSGIRSDLTESSVEALHRFQLGTGTAGLNREAYYAGWRAVGALLGKGFTLSQLARIKEDELPPLVDRVLQELTE